MTKPKDGYQPGFFRVGGGSIDGSGKFIPSVDGVIPVTTSPVVPKFIASDYPACKLLFNSDSVLVDGGTDLVDLVQGLVFRNAGDEVVVLNGSGFTPTKVGGASTPTFSLVGGGTMPALSTDNALVVLVSQKAVSSDPYFELGDSTNGVGIYSSVRGGVNSESYLVNTSSDYLSGASPLTASSDAVGTVLAGAVAINRKAATDAEMLRDYRVYGAGVEYVGSGAEAGTANWATLDMAVYDSQILINISGADVKTKYYVAAVFHMDSPLGLPDETVFTALRWMRENPGYLWPGLKNLVSP
jgi:hypothetical protein